MFNNCYTYNQPRSSIYKQAQKLENYLQTLLKKLGLIEAKQVMMFDKFKANANRKIDQINPRIILKAS